MIKVTHISDNVKVEIEVPKTNNRYLDKAIEYLLAGIIGEIQYEINLICQNPMENTFLVCNKHLLTGDLL